jgi:hypothetical protein
LNPAFDAGHSAGWFHLTAEGGEEDRLQIGRFLPDGGCIGRLLGEDSRVCSGHFTSADLRRPIWGGFSILLHFFDYFALVAAW